MLSIQRRCEMIDTKELMIGKLTTLGNGTVFNNEKCIFFCQLGSKITAINTVYAEIQILCGTFHENVM